MSYFSKAVEIQIMFRNLGAVLDAHIEKNYEGNSDVECKSITIMLERAAKLACEQGEFTCLEDCIKSVTDSVRRMTAETECSTLQFYGDERECEPKDCFYRKIYEKPAPEDIDIGECTLFKAGEEAEEEEDSDCSVEFLKNEIKRLQEGKNEGARYDMEFNRVSIMAGRNDSDPQNMPCVFFPQNKDEDEDEFAQIKSFFSSSYRNEIETDEPSEAVLFEKIRNFTLMKNIHIRDFDEYNKTWYCTHSDSWQKGRDFQPDCRFTIQIRKLAITDKGYTIQLERTSGPETEQLFKAIFTLIKADFDL